MSNRRYGYYYTAPLVFWVLAFFLIPISIILVFSFLKKGLYGGVIYEFSLSAYQSLLNPTLFKVLITTLYMSCVATLLTLMLAIPTGYFIARSKHKNFFLFLIIIPFWTNFLIRIYAWIAILGNNGFLNQFLIKSGLLENSIQFLYNPLAVILVLTYTYLPFAVLPLYSTIEKFDFSLLEAARDLGATKFESFYKILLPNIKSGIFSAILFVFIPAFGAYAIPQLVGGRNSFMIGNIIARELTVTRNWPLASAMSSMLTFITIIGVLYFLRENNKGSKNKTNVKA
ncbi:MAG: ABC transporter permease [Candidatus Riflemargulisbacteria bacterium]